LGCQVTSRYGVLYLRYWGAPVGCRNKFIQLTNIPTRC